MAEAAAEEFMFKRSTIHRDFSQLNKLVYGLPKSGKSTFCSVMKTTDGREPLFIATEDGHGALAVYVQRVTSWDGFKKLVGILRERQETVRRQYGVIVVDLVSDLDQMCSEYIAKKKSVEHVADLEFGKGFSLVKQEFQSVIRELMAVLPVTFIAHAGEREMQWNGEKIKVQAPSLSKGALDLINGKVDLIAWITPANNKRTLPEISMKNTTMSIAGTRYKQLARSWPLHVNEPSRTYAEIQKTFATETRAVLEQSDDPSEARKRVGAEASDSISASV